MKKIDNVELHGAANEVVIAATDKNLILPWKEMRQVLSACCISHLVVGQAEDFIDGSMKRMSARHAAYPALDAFYRRGIDSFYDEGVVCQWTYAQSESVSADNILGDTIVRVPVLEILAEIEEHKVIIQLMPTFSGEGDQITALALIADFTNVGDDQPGVIFPLINNVLENWGFWDETPNPTTKTLSQVSMQSSSYNFRAAVRDLMKFGVKTDEILHLKVMMTELYKNHHADTRTADTRELPQEVLQFMSHYELAEHVPAFCLDISLIQTGEQLMPSLTLYFENNGSTEENMVMGPLRSATIYHAQRDNTPDEGRSSFYDIKLMNKEMADLRVKVLATIEACE